MASVSMHTPATTMRLPAGAAMRQRLQHAGRPDALEDQRRASRSGLGPRRSRPRRGCAGTPSSAQQSWGDTCAGSTTSRRPSARAAARRSAREVAATIGPRPRAFSEAITASPTGPQPTTRSAWSASGSALATACSPTASGSVRARVRATGRWEPPASGPRRAASARRSRPGCGWNSRWSRRRRRPISPGIETTRAPGLEPAGRLRPVLPAPRSRTRGQRPCRRPCVIWLKPPSFSVRSIMWS